MQSPTEMAESEPLGKPMKPKTKPWIPIVAIVVVIALIGTAFVVLFVPLGAPEGPFLDAKTAPSSVNLYKGQQVKIIGYATYKNNSEDTGINVSRNVASLQQFIKWDGTPLGTLTRGLTDDSEVYETLKSTTVGSARLNWTFKYTAQDNTVYTKTVFINITVNTEILGYLEISPSSAVMLKNTMLEFTVKAYMTDDTEPTGASFSWELNTTEAGTISDDTGNATTVTAANVTDTVDASLICTATYAGVTIDSSAEIMVIHTPPPQEIDTRIYDLFNVPFRDFWNQRNDSFVQHNSFPYIEQWRGAPAGNNWLYSDARMNVTAKNVTTVSTSGNPWYVPVLNPTVKGGNIWLDWKCDYLTEAEALADYPASISGWYDGWFWRWNGTVTMDRTAAKMVLGMTDADFNNFDNWKATSFGTVKTKWSQWISAEADKWGVYWAYEYVFNGLSETYDIKKVGDKIVFLIVDHMSWGAESLLQRWWRYTFLHYEYWPENVHFTGHIGTMWSDFNIEQELQYTLQGYNTTKEGKPAWVFEVVHADALTGGSSQYQSELTKYKDNPNATYDGYYTGIIGSGKYGTYSDFDYTPYFWNLGVNDSLVIEWEDSENYIGYIHDPANPTDITNTITGHITPRWIEPIPTELPDNVMVDLTNTTITFKGPMDALNWSKYSVNARELRENWSRINNPPLLPRGCPWIEFVVNTETQQAPIVTIGGPTKVANDTNVVYNGSGCWDVDGQIVSWDWDMGDGSTYTTPVVTHKYTVLGNYILNLTVTDDDGLTATAILHINVSLNLQPDAVIKAPSVGFRGIPMTFDGSFSTDDDGTISNYTWNYGDGQMGYGAIVSHTYPDVYGVYTVTLTVTDDNLVIPLSDQATLKISIVSGPGLPVAKIVSPMTAIAGQATQLSGLMSYSSVNGSSVTVYDWDFGDTNTGTVATPSHTWAAAGTYTITLTVEDNNGNVSYPVTQSIEVVAAGARNIALSLDRHSLLPGESTTLTVRVVDGQGTLVSTYSGTADLECNATVGVTLPATATITNGVGSVSVTFANAGAYRINATVGTMTSSEFASVNQRTVEFTIYDIFQYPLYAHWDRRVIYYSMMDEPYRNTTPVVEIYRPGTQVTEAQLTTTYRLNVEARNVNEIRITNPTFVPRMNPTAGTTGSAHYDVGYQYQSDAQLWDLYQEGKISLGQYNAKDGWEYYMSGNLTMDRTSAAHLIDLPVLEADVPAWWVINNWTIGYDNWQWLWWTNESGYTLNSGRIDIRASDDGYPINQGYWNSEFWLQEWADGSVSLKFWRIGYGEDILLMRQLYWGGES
ncbi:MAG: PKD domain-containing protein, partial [Thermoplasmata archaeon]|nr:PKD domain-containing protein [Thermoplasmata archaeon]